MTIQLDELTVTEAVFSALQSGESIPDIIFDQIYPESIKSFSELHWTPVSIAKRAAELLVQDSNTRVLDVGSGCGKFCLVGGLTTPGIFYGVEQRENLVHFGKTLVDRHSLKRIQFMLGDLRNVDWNHFHAFYLYNPFVENIYANEIRIDDTVELSQERYIDTVRWVQMRLHFLPVGTRVVTYHGFGGDMPPGYDLKVEEPGDGDCLRLWIKERETT